jgi:hypothetical protein
LRNIAVAGSCDYEREWLRGVSQRGSWGGIVRSLSVDEADMLTWIVCAVTVAATLIMVLVSLGHKAVGKAMRESRM